MCEKPGLHCMFVLSLSLEIKSLLPGLMELGSWYLNLFTLRSDDLDITKRGRHRK
jgi:hypothetical protein